MIRIHFYKNPEAPAVRLPDLLPHEMAGHITIDGEHWTVNPYWIDRFPAEMIVMQDGRKLSDQPEYKQQSQLFTNGEIAVESAMRIAKESP